LRLFFEPYKPLWAKQGAPGRYWVLLELTGKNILVRLLSDTQLFYRVYLWIERVASVIDAFNVYLFPMLNRLSRR